MIISDKLLIENAIKYKDRLYLNPETIEALESITERKTGSFQSNEVIDIIINKVWPLILQDSIYNLKSCDFREYAHWSEENKKSKRDINNDYTFGLDSLHKYFKEFTEFEKILYGVDGRYRDHVVHVFRVWLLGLTLLLDSESGIKMSVNDICFDELISIKERIVVEKEIISMWAIIALCHDLGYPLGKAEEINEAVERMYRHLGKMNIQRFSAAFQQEHQFLNKFILDFISSKIEIEGDKDKIEELYKKYDSFVKSSADDLENINLFIYDKFFRTVVQAKYYIKFAKSLEMYNHGIISCTILFKSLFYFLESDYNMQEKPHLSFEDARQFCIRKEILRSIAAHTCPEVYHLKPNTFSFLLIFCDELQEWGRPNFVELQSDNIKDKEIEIIKFSNEEIEFKIKESVDKEPPNDIAQKVFGKWHAILRSAVFDTARRFTMTFILNINNIEYKFNFKNNNLVVTCNSKPFKIYNIET